MKIVMILTPLILIGLAFGLATQGIVNIPGISPKPKKAAKKGPDVKVEEKKKDEVVKPKPKPPAPVVKKKEPEPDLIKGDKTIAGVWAEIPTPQLVKITSKWKDTDLARVLYRMDSDKVAELLGSMDENRASKLSKELQRLASIPPRPEGA